MIFRGCLLLVGFFLVVGCSESRVEIAKTTRPEEANEIYVALERHGIPDALLVEDEDSRQPTLRIEVAPAQVAQARQILALLNLPRPSGAAEEGGGLSSRSPDEVWNRLRHSQEVQVSEALRVAGFHDARVVVGAHNPRDPYAGPARGSDLRVEARAARALASLVWIKEANDSVCPLNDAEIQILIANAFPGLQADQVEVVVRALEIPAMTRISSDQSPTGAAPKLLFVATSVIGMLCVALALGYVRQRSRLLRALDPEAANPGAVSTVGEAA